MICLQLTNHIPCICCLGFSLSTPSSHIILEMQQRLTPRKYQKRRTIKSVFFLIIFGCWRSIMWIFLLFSSKGWRKSSYCYCSLWTLTYSRWLRSQSLSCEWWIKCGLKTVRTYSLLSIYTTKYLVMKYFLIIIPKVWSWIIRLLWVCVFCTIGLFSKLTGFAFFHLFST